MTHHKLIIIFATIITLVLNQGCTEDFEEIDQPKTTSADIDSKYLFTRSLVSGSGISVGIWQYVHQLRGSVYAQHFANINSDFTTGNYEPLNGDKIWEWYYAKEHFAPLNLNHQVIELAEEEENPIKQGCARIWNVYMFHQITDMYGDIPYFDAFEMPKPPFDSQQEIYEDMLKELSEAVVQLEENQGLGYDGNGEADVLYEGDIDKWIRFANTLTLKLALRVSDVAENDLTQEYLNKISPEETIDSESEAKILPDSDGPTYHVKNPLRSVYQWDEIRLSSTMKNYLDEFNDPRLEIFAEPNVDGGYVGLRNGQYPDSLSSRYNSHYVPDYCNIGSFFVEEDTPHYLMTYAESSFMKAEAAFKGYISGSAEDFYNEGVRASMNQFGIHDEDTIDAYLQGEAQYDPDNALKQIFTQRWIALYPNGHEAWSMVRRTGYPELMEPVYTYPGNDKMPRRVPYPVNERRYNKENYDEAVERMGGDDQYVNVWWDQN
ncbi:MAG: SusD/RagB family nutrient-binding outer membrane lipoprotein [Bacteroidales bacterium]